MALVECEECGKQVSDRAEAYPNCGNPIAIKPVELRFLNQYVISYKCYVSDAETGEELWAGKQGNIAKIDTNNEKKTLSIKISGGNGTGEIEVKPGDKLLIEGGLLGIKYRYADEPDHDDGDGFSVGMGFGFGHFW